MIFTFNQKSASSLVLVSFVLLSLFALIVPIQARAALSAGDLVTCPEFSAVYYVAEDGQRYTFPSDKVYFTYFEHFDFVKTISCVNLSDLALGGNITYRAGTRLVKLPSVPSVYAVEPGGILRALSSEEQATAIYGEDWAGRVDDLSEAFYSSYELGEELEDGELPAGLIIQDDNESVTRIDEDGDRENLDIYKSYYAMDTLVAHFVLMSDVEAYSSGSYESYTAMDYTRYEVLTSPITDVEEISFFHYGTQEEHPRGDFSVAEVVLVEYADLDDPFSSRHHETLLEVMEVYGDQVTWIYRHYPLSYHEEALPSAMAVECAGEQSEHVFWYFIDDIYEKYEVDSGTVSLDLAVASSDEQFGREYYLTLAEGYGLDLETFAACYDNDGAILTIELDQMYGEEDGVTGTPTVFVNNQQVSGAVSLESLSEVIDEELGL